MEVLFPPLHLRAGTILSLLCSFPARPSSSPHSRRGLATEPCPRKPQLDVFQIGCVPLVGVLAGAGLVEDLFVKTGRNRGRGRHGKLKFDETARSPGGVVKEADKQKVCGTRRQPVKPACGVPWGGDTGSRRQRGLKQGQALVLVGALYPEKPLEPLPTAARRPVPPSGVRAGGLPTAVIPSCAHCRPGR